MPIHHSPREKDAISRILKDINMIHTGLDIDHLVDVVANEAHRHGIKPSISCPITRQLIAKSDVRLP